MELGRLVQAPLFLDDTSGANLVAIQRDGWLIQPTGKTELRAGDVLLIDLYTDKAAAEVMRQTYSLQPLPLKPSKRQPLDAAPERFAESPVL